MTSSSRHCHTGSPCIRPTSSCSSCNNQHQQQVCMQVCPSVPLQKKHQLEMWANAQRNGHPAEYRWRPLFNAAVWLTPTTRVPCSNAAKTGNPLKLPGVPQTNETISAASGLKFTILWGHVEEILLLNKFFVDTCRSCEDIAQQSCAMVPRWRFLATFWVLHLQRAACSTFQTCILNSH